MADRIPIEAELVPPLTELPPELTRVRRLLNQGLPERIELDAKHTLVLVLPTGVANTWRDADPAALVVSSDPEQQAAASGATGAIGSLARPPLRLLVLVGGALQGALPVVAGLHRSFPDGGRLPAALEVFVLSFALYAGNVRGAGDNGSYLELAWRPLGAGSSSFASPPLVPRVAQRLGPRFRIESELGAVRRQKRVVAL
jgi:hypothetical protein